MPHVLLCYSQSRSSLLSPSNFYILSLVDSVNYAPSLWNTNQTLKLDPSPSPREPADELTSAPSFTTMAAQTWIWTSLTVVVTVILTVVNANSEGDALFTLRKSLSDPDNVLQSWDPTLVNPCTWFHITCNQDNRVTRL